jgi:hypothetical protein
MSDEEKIEIDFRRKEIEAGWIRIVDKFGPKGAPVWFSWLSRVLALGAFEYGKTPHPKHRRLAQPIVPGTRPRTSSLTVTPAGTSPLAIAATMRGDRNASGTRNRMWRATFCSRSAISSND